MSTIRGPVKPLKAVIFDLDGTLLDTETLSSLAMQQVLDPFQVKEDWALKERILGLRGSEWGPLVVKHFALEGQLDPQFLVREWEANLKKLSPQVQAMPGAYEIVSHLKSKGIPMAIATSSHASAVESKKRNHAALFDLIDVVVCGDHKSVERGKPHPDIYLAAFRELCERGLVAGGEAQEKEGAKEGVVCFEDALAGVSAAVKAGMVCVAVPDARCSADFRDKCGQLTSYVIDSLAEVPWSQLGLD